MAWRPLSKNAAVTADIIWRLQLTHSGRRGDLTTPAPRLCGDVHVARAGYANQRHHVGSNHGVMGGVCIRPCRDVHIGNPGQTSIAVSHQQMVALSSGGSETKGQGLSATSGSVS